MCSAHSGQSKHYGHASHVKQFVKTHCLKLGNSAHGTPGIVWKHSYAHMNRPYWIMSVCMVASSVKMHTVLTSTRSQDQADDMFHWPEPQHRLILEMMQSCHCILSRQNAGNHSCQCQKQRVLAGLLISEAECKADLCINVHGDMDGAWGQSTSQPAIVEASTEVQLRGCSADLPRS